MFVLGVNFDAHMVAYGIVSASDTSTSPAFVLSLVEGLCWFMMFISVVAFIIGILLCGFPRAIHTLEVYANRWCSMRKATANTEVMHLPLDRWVEKSSVCWGVD